MQPLLRVLQFARRRHYPRLQCHRPNQPGPFPADSTPGIYSGGTTSISNTTIASDTSPFSTEIGGIFGGPGDLMQNSIVANNSGANCFSGITSKGYNLSRDGSCNFHNSGDRNNTDPQA
jgi:hypothetical protein